jgi:glutathione S-transferase
MARARNLLVTIVFSHYNEKARWALDHCGIAYEERAYMPGFSWLGVVLATRGRGGCADKVSSRFSTPVLVTCEGEALCDSTDIARWAAAHAASDVTPLFPVPEVLDLVHALGTDLGPYTRIAWYHRTLDNPRIMADLASRNVSRGQALAFRAMGPLGSMTIARYLGVTEESYRRAVACIYDQLAKVEQRLDRGPYLVGDTFTAADLTFASLLAPVLLVSREEGYSARFPSRDEVDSEARAFVDDVRATRAGKFALEMFRRHRHR